MDTKNEFSNQKESKKESRNSLLVFVFAFIRVLRIFLNVGKHERKETPKPPPPPFLRMKKRKDAKLKKYQ